MEKGESMDINKLETLSQPLIEFIKEQDILYLKIEIDENGIKALSTEAFIPKFN